MAERWIYDIGGQAIFYQQDNYIYTAKGGTCEYWVSRACSGCVESAELIP